jgi:hypothetical protein
MMIKMRSSQTINKTGNHFERKLSAEKIKNWIVVRQICAMSIIRLECVHDDKERQFNC